MNVLIVGHGSGSWTMRGLQLGAAIGARVTGAPIEADWRWADVAVLVKRAGLTWAAEARRRGVPMVWDALDFWRQPAQNGYTEGTARHLFREQLTTVQPVFTIGATQAMAVACQGIYLSHHSWEGLTPTPARAVVRTVAYQGEPAYLGKWRPALEQACRRRGWQFVINPPDLSAADLIVAFRDGNRDGWMCREWKSGIKAVNAIAAGRPFISQASAAVRELVPDGTVIEDPKQLDAAFDAWSGQAIRAVTFERCLRDASAYRLPAVAEQYQRLLSQVEASCTA